MAPPTTCENGHIGFMKEFSKEGRTWWSCTFKYGDGKTCWGKVPKDAPVIDNQPIRVRQPDLGDALNVAWQITLSLNSQEDLLSFGPRKIAASVRRMALFLATGELQDEETEPKRGMSQDDKLQAIQMLKAQIAAIGDIDG